MIIGELHVKRSRRLGSEGEKVRSHQLYQG